MVFENQFAFPRVQILQCRGLYLCPLIQCKASEKKDPHLLLYFSQGSQSFLITCKLELQGFCCQLVSGVKRKCPNSVYCNTILSNIMDVKKRHAFPQRGEGED